MTRNRFVHGWLFALVWLAVPASAADVPVVGLSAQPGNLKFSPGMTMASLANRPATDMVEFSNGGRLSVGTLRRLQGMAKQLKSPAPVQIPAALTAKPAATGVKIKTAEDLASVMKLPDSATVQLPSGRLVTVGQIKFLRPRIERALFRRLEDVPTRPNLTGTEVQVSARTTRAEWRNILEKPGDTRLVSPRGKKTTVADLKQAMADLKSTMPSSSRPKGGANAPKAPRPARDAHQVRPIPSTR